jgi:hypothetical protein
MEVYSICVLAKSGQNTHSHTHTHTHTHTQRRRHHVHLLSMPKYLGFWNYQLQSKFLTFTALDNLNLADVDTVLVLPAL